MASYLSSKPTITAKDLKLRVERLSVQIVLIAAAILPTSSHSMSTSTLVNLTDSTSVITHPAYGDAPRSLDDLIKRLHEVLDGDTADSDEISWLMTHYSGSPIEWRKFAMWDDHRYTRNLVDDGNGKFNLMLLCWGEGQSSTIHDHSGCHCFMKVMDGEISEQLYEMPSDISPEVLEDGSCGKEMKSIRETSYKKGGVVYINDKIGLHRVENKSHSKKACTLHLYSPPFDYCRTFDERTGKGRVSGRVTFFSKNGKKVVRDNCVNTISEAK